MNRRSFLNAISLAPSALILRPQVPARSQPCRTNISEYPVARDMNSRALPSKAEKRSATIISDAGTIIF
jgi:hypothetical protein